MQLLSDYEDALAALHQASVAMQGDEAAILVEMRRLHARVRTLRLDVLDLMEHSRESG